MNKFLSGLFPKAPVINRETMRSLVIHLGSKEKHLSLLQNLHARNIIDDALAGSVIGFKHHSSLAEQDEEQTLLLQQWYKEGQTRNDS